MFKLLIVTGLSGAGKSQVIHCLEDIGFYCVDNMPSDLMPAFVDVCRRSKGKLDRVALVMDIRGGESIGHLSDMLKSMKESGIHYDILFLEANDDTIVKRYKESRRKHPLADHCSVEEAITRERNVLSSLRSMAAYIIDTTDLPIKLLHEQIKSIYDKESMSGGALINVMSFGFKYGLPRDADLVFDVRCLPNPFYIPDLKPKTGLMQEVYDYVMQFPQSVEMLKKLTDFLDFSIPLYLEEGKRHIVIAVGCTGGKHRSVTFARKIGEHLRANNQNVLVYHRDIEKDSLKLKAVHVD